MLHASPNQVIGAWTPDAEPVQARGGDVVERLRATLEANGQDAAVKVRPRHRPLDLYA
jgi:hypothetical protein